MNCLYIYVHVHSIFPVHLDCYEYDEDHKNWCADNSDISNICSGARDDCLKKGKTYCENDVDCYGIMFHSGWSYDYKGIKVCRSKRMTSKGDWQAFMIINKPGTVKWRLNPAGINKPEGFQTQWAPTERKDKLTHLRLKTKRTRQRLIKLKNLNLVWIKCLYPQRKLSMKQGSNI